MKRPIKVLHIAAFDGNVGDTGQLMGFRQQLHKNTGLDFCYTNIEIRDFYQSWGKRKFDNKFVELANKYDLLIFGGGNFWSLDWENSSNGTTLDLSEKLLDDIKVPIWFNALGFDDGINFKKSKISDFERFLKKLLNEPYKYFLSVRNDGSKQLMYKYLDSELVDKVYEVPDGGFFVQVQKSYHPELPKDKKIIAVNPAGDMSNIRFKEGEITEQGYLDDLSHELINLLNNYENIHLVFVAHMPTDMEHIVKIINKFPDWYKRQRISVAPYIPHFEYAEYIFDLYKKSDVVIGGRFQSNLCAIAKGTPTIGILSYHKHKNVYERYGMKHRMIEIDRESVKGKLTGLIDDMLVNKEIYINQNKKLVEKLQREIYNVHNLFVKWMDKSFKQNSEFRL